MRLPLRVALVATTLCACEPSTTSVHEAPRSVAAPATASTAPRPALSPLPKPPVEPGSMAPYLTAVGDQVLMTWIERLDGTAARGGSVGSRHRVRFSRLDGGVWSEPSTISEGDEIVANWADVPNVAQAADGALVAHWAEKAGDALYAYDVVLARSSDKGVTWKRVGTAHDDKTETEHGFVSMVPEGNAVRAFWLDGRQNASGHGGATTLRTALVTGDGVTAGEIVDERVCDCCRTSAVTTPGGPLVVYRDRSDASTASESRDIAAMRRTGTKWRDTPIRADGWNITGCPVNGPAMVSRDKRVATAWFTYAEQRSQVLVALSEDGGLTFLPPTVVDAAVGRRAPLGRVGVALGDTDTIVSWLASDREEGVLLVSRVAADGRVGPATTITTTQAQRDSGFPQMVRVGDRLVFAWTDAGERATVSMRQLELADLAAPAKKVEVTTADPAFKTGSAAPALVAKTLDGDDTTLSSLLGEPVLLNLWATWCEPCRAELDELKTLHERHDKQGLVVLAVSVDRQQTPEQILKFVERRKLPFTVWHDRQDAASDAFVVSTLPASFVINREGIVTFARTGAITATDKPLNDALQQVLTKAR